VEEPIWIRDDVVMAIHRRQLAEHGGSEGVREHGLLASALVRPRHMLAYADPPPDLASLAAAYAFGIVRNHPFLDGNKRTAWVVARTFLKLNGCDLSAPQEEKYLTVMSLADGSLAEEEFADWVRQRLTQVSTSASDTAG
jgi:death-on-curing protein